MIGTEGQPHTGSAAAGIKCTLEEKRAGGEKSHQKHPHNDGRNMIMHSVVCYIDCSI